MARRELSRRLCSLLPFALAVTACRHEQRAPAPSASASAAGNDFTAQSRERHFQEELARAQARWRDEPGLGDCAPALKEATDLELCQAAAKAVSAIEAEPGTTPEHALTLLAPGALALARLSQRVRYLSLAELAERHLQGDAGASPVPAVTGAAARAGAAVSQARRPRTASSREPRAVELREGAVSQLMDRTIHLERDVLRNLGAYLEYGPLPTRRAALETVKRLRSQRPQWPLLEHLLREAVVLESDGDLKRDLRACSAAGLPTGTRPGQSAETR